MNAVRPTSWARGGIGALPSDLTGSVLTLKNDRIPSHTASILLARFCGTLAERIEKYGCSRGYGRRARNAGATSPVGWRVQLACLLKTPTKGTSHRCTADRLGQLCARDRVAT